RSRVFRDQRENSRIIALLDCRFIHNNLAYDAVIVDLSQKGAKLSSKFMPPAGSEIVTTIRSNQLENELKLYGKVLRGARVMTDHGNMGRFVVRFHNTPLDLISLLGKLLGSQSSNL
ncbi:MAG: PilZ domain-containing protein, partial [Desulfobacteraceae bacterium]